MTDNRSEAHVRLEEWRRKIDEIDAELVRLLNQRARYAEEIGRLKLILKLPAYSPEREEEVMNNVTKENRGPLSPAAVRRLFERIIDESRAVERNAMLKSAGGELKSDES